VIESCPVRNGSLDEADSVETRNISTETRTVSTDTRNVSTHSSSYAMNLKDESFKDDFSPLVGTCSCYTCRCHTRGYLNHLLATQEMLGPTLLMIHNLYHLGTFFTSIRDSITAGSYNQMYDMIKLKGDL
jgi:queuine tRNA-ribosyltransferase subunit QTRTD1